MIGTTFADRYDITGLLGAGANPVWRAWDTHQERDVALKTFKPGSSTIIVYGEAAVLTALEGEHVLRVYNADTYGDIPYIATRIASMGSTEDLRKANPRGLPADVVIPWIRQALVGLGACHDRRLVHRDVKPENIFLESTEFALLGDFGLVHQLATDGTVPADGSPLTLAPEMWLTNRGSLLSDIYSMGVTAYRLIAGAWPVEAQSREEMRVMVPTGRFRRLRDVAPHVSRRLADRIEKAMRLDPSERFEGWRQMHEELGRPGIIGRVWRRRSPHPGHTTCWVETRDSGQARQVCCIPLSSQAWSIDVRYATESGRRLTDLCAATVSRRRLAAALKSVFNELQ